MLNATPWRTARKRPRRPAGIPCHCSMSRTFPEFHEVLLGFEGRGLAGVVEVMEHLDVAEDLAEHEGMTYVDFPDWVYDHRWEDPRSVVALARRLSEADWCRRELRQAQTVIDSAATILKQAEARRAS